MHDIIAHLLEFVRAHQAWAAPLTFVFAFLKSLAFVSLLVPGTTILLGIGAVIGASDLPIVPVWLAVSVGAALGDWVSYAIGRRFDRAATSIGALAWHPDVALRAEAFFRRWGVASIVACRFFGPLRATVPLMAGVLHMSRTSFQIANWASAFLWAAALLLPGQIFVH